MKTILTLTLALIVSAAFAQSNDQKPQPNAEVTKTPTAPTVKKPEYIFDPNRFVRITINIDQPIGIIDSYLFVASQGGPDGLNQSETLTMKQGTGLKSVYKTVKDSIDKRLYDKFKRLTDSLKNKFTADTTAKYHPAIKK